MEDVRKVTLEELKNKYELEKNKFYEKDYEIVYEEYKRFIKEDLASLIEDYFNKHIYTLNGKINNINVVGSLFENIRLEWLEKFFRDNNLGKISCFPSVINNDNEVKYTLITKYNIRFNSSTTFEDLFKACMKNIPPLEEMKMYFKINPITKMKNELEKQKKAVPLNNEMYDKLSDIFPKITFDSEIVPYNMFKLVINEFKLKNYFEDVTSEDKLALAIQTLVKMNFSYEYIAIFTGIDINAIVTMTKNKTLELRRD